ncbi:hypothetical protein NZK33_05070 [Cyanobium sp. FGCU-6]|jgi:hypothetical protein|nr:hypothetical protein [Cyanobium sp. FGCU6]
MVPNRSRALLITTVMPLLLAASQGSGSGADDPNLCLLAPHGEPLADGRVQALVPLARPTIFVADPLADVRLEQGGRQLWQRRAPLLEPIQGPLPWPLPPLRPGERMLLRLRPVGEPEGNLATIELEAAPAAVLTRNESLRAGLGNDGERWLRAVEQALERGDEDLAAALLFAAEGPSTPSLNGLRRTAFQQGCGTPGPARLETAPSPGP